MDFPPFRMVVGASLERLGDHLSNDGGPLRPLDLHEIIENEDESQGSNLEEESIQKGPITRAKAKEIQGRVQAFIQVHHEELANNGA